MPRRTSEKALDQRSWYSVSRNPYKIEEVKETKKREKKGKKGKRKKSPKLPVFAFAIAFPT